MGEYSRPFGTVSSIDGHLGVIRVDTDAKSTVKGK